MELSEIVEVFYVESSELLESMESLLLELEKNPKDQESMNALFRAIHTIKGTSGMFGFEEIVRFTHIVENLLDLLREGKLGFQESLSEILLESKDHISYLVHTEPKGKGIPDDKVALGDKILEKIRPFLSSNSEEMQHSHEPHEEQMASSPINTEGIKGISDYLISLRPGLSVLRNGLDPIAFISYLKKLGEIQFLKVITDTLPIHDFDAESSYLGYEIRFQSTSDPKAVAKVFEFMESDAAITVLPPGSSVWDLAKLAKGLPEEEISLGQLWKEMGVLGEETYLLYLESLKPGASPESILALPIEKEKTVATIATNATDQKSGQEKTTILKVDGSKIDQLINRVGELVVASASINQSDSFREDSSLQEASHLVNRLINEIREISLKLRMIQIGDIFQKYQRTVRDLGKELKKDIKLHISGKETELDRTIVDKLSDPLTHLIRNACDHGLESTKQRIESGKPQEGNIWLDAFHDTGSVVIQIRDDGKGIIPEKIWKRGLEKNLVSGSPPSNPEEIYKLLFMPGFSTAEAVTNVSGRGVGLDVVQRNIESLRGTILVESEEGKGTKFTIRLPLTLAIIEGFLVSVANSLFIIPMVNVLECLEFRLAEEETSNHYFALRGNFLPYLRVREIFPTEGETPAKRENIVIVSWGERKAGLVVDELFGEFQTVIKPLGSVFQNVQGISGSSILADGRVALILDLPSLFEKTIELEKAAVT